VHELRAQRKSGYSCPAPEQRQPFVRRGAHQPRLAVHTQLVARVQDVQVPHRQLADAILRREEHLVALLHRQPLGW